ncbi:MAG TPA: DUF2062 domain-containing protein [Gammaproteobacteria bacterium]|nr:DUF2062 domain-containing protein [Gammaproteobacteria bacterium]
MKHLHQNKLVRLVKELLIQGITPHKIALTIALGVVLGVTPVLGSTTLLCALAALALGLNLPLIQLVNYLIYPLQFVLLLPFIQAGQWLFREPPFPLSLTQIAQLVRANLWHAIASLWSYSLHALIAWLILSSAATLIIYFMLLPILRYFVPAQGFDLTESLSKSKESNP